MGHRTYAQRYSHLLRVFLHPRLAKVTTVTVNRVLSVDKAFVDFGQRAVGTKAEVSYDRGAGTPAAVFPEVMVMT